MFYLRLSFELGSYKPKHAVALLHVAVHVKPLLLRRYWQVLTLTTWLLVFYPNRIDKIAMCHCLPRQQLIAWFATFSLVLFYVSALRPHYKSVSFVAVVLGG